MALQELPILDLDYMMRIPTTSTMKTPYLFRTGVGTEIHNFNPMNTSGGVFLI